MKEYYIEDENGRFWCENNFGYWSNYLNSLKYRFEGIFMWVFPLYVMMRMSKVKCKMVEIKFINAD